MFTHMFDLDGVCFGNGICINRHGSIVKLAHNLPITALGSEIVSLGIPSNTLDKMRMIGNHLHTSFCQTRERVIFKDARSCTENIRAVLSKQAEIMKAASGDQARS